MYRTPNTSKHHKNAAKHHDQAADHHREASRHHANGNFETAAHHAQAARGHSLTANDFANQASKHHAEFEDGTMEENADDYSRTGFGDRGGRHGNNYQQSDDDMSYRRSARTPEIDEDYNENEAPNGRSSNAMGSGARQQGRRSKTRGEGARA